jgi:tetratricopeptide (TPR) repeat protein
VGDRIGASSLSTNLAQLEYERGHFETALAMLESCVRVKVDLGERYGECIARYSIGLVHKAMKHRNEAIAALEEALAIAREIREQLVIDEVERALRSVSA